MPEYVGYADQAVHEDVFVSCKPRIELRGDFHFKYYADLEAAEAVLRTENVGGILVSRPTNPSGNVLTDGEIRRLADLAKRHGIPLIVDNAYGLPFPGIVFTEATPYWDESVVLSMSLSKIGLPSARTGIIVARKEIVAALSATNAIASLATGTVGQAIAEPLIASGEILKLSSEVVRPYYLAKRERALALMRSLFSVSGAGPRERRRHLHVALVRRPSHRFPGIVYPPEGAVGHGLVGGILLLRELRRRLSCAAWDHPRRCIRINYSGGDDQVERGLTIIAEEVRAAYGKRGL
jgi:valine--pyruvate aminotransferase